MAAKGRVDYATEYGKLHERSKRFPGTSIKAYVDAIGALCEEVDASQGRLLDYGCGKGMQYLAHRVHEKWTSGGEKCPLPHCYDIGVPALSQKPEGLFEGVICTDVMEHIDEPDVGAVLKELVEYVGGGGFLFLGISCRPANKSFDDGRNLHLTIQPPSWWIERIKAAAKSAKRNPDFAAPESVDIHVVAHFDVAGHFDEPETPFDEYL